VIEVKAEKLDHVHIYVKDIQKAVQLFADSLGLKFDDVYTWEEEGLKDCYAPPGVLFIQSTSPNDALGVSKFIESKGEGLAAISLKVTDIETAIAELQSKGFRLKEKVEIGNVKEAMFDPEDSFGVEIELCEYPGDDIAAAAASEILEKAAQLTKQSYQS